MQQFRFRALALSHDSATFEDKTTHPLQTLRSALHCAEVVKLDDEENDVRRDASIGVELCLEDGPSPVYRKEKPPLPRAKDTGLKKRSCLRQCYRPEKKWKTATRSGDGENGRIDGANNEEMETEVHGEEVTIVSKKMETETVKETRTEKKKGASTRFREQEKVEVIKKDTIDTTPTDCSGKDPQAGQGIRVLKSAMTKYCFLREASYIDSEDE